MNIKMSLKHIFKLKFILLLVLFSATYAGAIVAPEYFDKLRYKENQLNQHLMSQKKVLAGLVIRHGEIIDALQPIYRNINNDGSLGDTVRDQQFGGNGGNKTELLREGYVIVGIIYNQGYWMGSRRLAGFVPIMQKWENGKPAGDMIMSGSYGLVNKISGSRPYYHVPKQGKYISNIEVKVSDLSELGIKNDGIYVSSINISTDGTTTNEHQKASPKPKATNPPFSPDDQYYAFKVNIVSGTKQGQEVRGIVSFPKGEDNSNVSANRILMQYDGQCYSLKDMGRPKANINYENISNLTFVGGPGHHRFGLNAGFSRRQFGRHSEKFVRNGEEYFGYLHPNTIVDGVGRVSYKRLFENAQQVYNKLQCN